MDLGSKFKPKFEEEVIQTPSYQHQSYHDSYHQLPTVILEANKNQGIKIEQEMDSLVHFDDGEKDVFDAHMAENYDNSNNRDNSQIDSSNEPNTDFSVQCEFENNETAREHNGNYTNFNSQEDGDLVYEANFETIGEYDASNDCDDKICHFEMIEVVLQSSDAGAENGNLVGKMIRTEDLPQLIFEANQCENQVGGFIIDETRAVDIKNEAQSCGGMEGESGARSLENKDQICGDEIREGEAVNLKNEAQIDRKGVSRRAKNRPQMYVEGCGEQEVGRIKFEADLYESETGESEEEADDLDPDYTPLQEGMNIDNDDAIGDDNSNDNDDDIDLSDKPVMVKRKKRANTSHNKNPLQCNRCSKSFTTMQDLKDHKMDHRKKKYHCATCNKNFILKARFLKHMEIHMENIACKECGKEFGDMEALLRHEKIHTGVKPYACDLCGKRFLEKGNCDSHRRTHTKEKPYKCPHCEKSFSDPSNFNRHRKSHSSVEVAKPHRCKLCDERFTRTTSLYRHYFRLHPDQEEKELFAKGYKDKNLNKTNECRYCDKMFWTKRDVERHESTHTGIPKLRPHECETCQQCFSSKTELRTHEKIHLGINFSCKQCDAKFSTNPLLKRHEKIHTGAKPHACDVCCKRFLRVTDMKVHKRVHTMERPYICEKCGQGFAAQTNVTKHRRICTGKKPFSCYLCGRGFDVEDKMEKHIEKCARRIQKQINV